LIRHVPVFSSRELPRGQPLMVGRTDAHVVFRIGPWTLSCAIQIDVRFPCVDQVIPDARATATRLQLDADDAAFQGQALDRLPGASETHSPVTLDCNGRIAVRARGPDQTQATELVLSRSHYTGTPVRLNTNRVFLARAARSGFGAIEIVDPETPIVCRAGRRTFAWQPLSKEAVLEPSDDVIRIESLSRPAPAAIQPDERASQENTPVDQRTRSRYGHA